MLRCRLWILNSVLLLTLLGSLWGRRIESATLPRADFLRQLNLSFRDWTPTDAALTAGEQQLLEPDAVLVRRYQSRTGDSAELAVIAGHRKKSVHTPGFCMAGGGWETLWQQETLVALPDRNVVATQALMSRERQQILVTYFFTDGEYCTRNLVQFQGVQMLKRFHAQVPLGALVRLIVPVRTDEDAARTLQAEFARTLLPPVLQSLRQARLEVKYAPGECCNVVVNV